MKLKIVIMGSLLATTLLNAQGQERITIDAFSQICRVTTKTTLREIVDAYDALAPEDKPKADKMLRINRHATIKQLRTMAAHSPQYERTQAHRMAHRIPTPYRPANAHQAQAPNQTTPRPEAERPRQTQTQPATRSNETTNPQGIPSISQQPSTQQPSAEQAVPQQSAAPQADLPKANQQPETPTENPIEEPQSEEKNDIGSALVKKLLGENAQLKTLLAQQSEQFTQFKAAAGARILSLEKEVHVYKQRAQSAQEAEILAKKAAEELAEQEDVLRRRFQAHTQHLESEITRLKAELERHQKKTEMPKPAHPRMEPIDPNNHFAQEADEDVFYDANDSEPAQEAPKNEKDPELKKALDDLFKSLDDAQPF